MHKVFFCKFLKFLMVTEAWNSAVRAKSWIQLLSRKQPKLANSNLLLITYHNLYISSFSDLCFFPHVFGNSLLRCVLLALSPEKYSRWHWLPYCKYSERNGNSTNTTSFFYNGHNPLHILISWKSFAKIQLNYKCKCHFVSHFWL